MDLLLCPIGVGAKNRRLQRPTSRLGEGLATLTARLGPNATYHAVGKFSSAEDSTPGVRLTSPK